MSGFEQRWLDLREPADHTARDHRLLTRAAELACATPCLVVDLGCGTGSTARALSPALSGEVEWRLVDHDQALLAEAERRLGAKARMVHADLTRIEMLPLDGASLVAASALFDLVSESWLEHFVERLAPKRTPLYAALSYDGRMDWREPHPLDERVVAAFNAHQRGEKGFGPALGPAAAETLTGMLSRQGWHVETARSDWRMDERLAALEAAFVDGVARAAAETSHIAPPDLADWHETRTARLGRGCTVGHLDLLAVPA